MQQLPDELLEQILLHLRPSHSHPYWKHRHDENKVLASTLAAVCQASKTCSRIATPMLYRTVDLFYRREDVNVGRGKGNSQEVGLIPLLRTCLCRRDLAMLIKELRFRARGDEIVRKDRKSRKERILPSEYYEQVLQSLSISVDLRLTLLRDLDYDLDDAALAILFCLLQNLESLQYTSGRSHQLMLAKRTLLELAENGSQYPFRKLQTLAVYPSDTHQRREATYWSTIRPFLYCPALRIVKASAYRAGPEAHDQFVLNNITRLQLDQPQFPHDGGAEALFLCFPHLKHLQLSVIARRASKYRLGVPGGLAAIASALRSHGSALESLLIVVSNTTAEFSFVEDLQWNNSLVPKASLGDLSSLTRLRELTTTMMALLQDERGGASEDDSLNEDTRLLARLPTSLERLRIVEVHEVGPDGVQPEGTAHEEYRRRLPGEILQLCCEDGLKRLQRIEVDGWSTLEGDIGGMGWTKEERGSSIVLTR